ncbi:EF-hand protein [Arthroderma uncinatum]|uniref:EF-hand protein n=1 Tax=Arthroderma uncinatum TaxID=74035 RepID=UPI00144A4EDF|nr:EF-hand protein [Arthroderma uncinatum]KAF3483406.1 EF-hand protein [Arthroderma uncinatum]
MPPKRRGTAASFGGPKEKKPRLSKLAKENNITSEEEAEIKEAFHLFAVSDNDEYPSEKEGVIATRDVRRVLIALGLAPKDNTELKSIISAVDPSGEGYVIYEHFLSIAALKLHNRTEDSISAEVEHAYGLFTHGSEGPILISHLRAVAKSLKEDVSEDLLKDMIREANGGEGIQAGVNIEQFKDVMSRAGVF